MKVRDVMNKKLSTVPPHTHIRDLWKLIFSKKVNAVPVVDKRSILQGIIAKEDLLSQLYPKFDEYITDFEAASDFEEMEKKVRSLGDKYAEDIMCRRVVFTRESTEVMRALSRMIVRHVDQLPVLDEKNKVIGILTKGDIFYALFKKRLSGTFKK